MDEKKRIIEFDAAESVPVDGQLPIDSASQGTKKITPALLLKAITDLLGDEALETLAQTLTGAVNEVKGIADDAQDLAENISDEYSSSSAYAKGDYCIHNNTLYKCTTAIGSGGEAWNASHWSATKCDDELSELKGTLSDQIKVVQKRLPDFTISAGATNSTRVNVDDVSGYKPCGIVGYTGSGTSGTALQEMYVANQETAIVYARNVTTSSITVTNIVAHILYIKV